jgi:hypothetical protein
MTGAAVMVRLLAKTVRAENGCLLWTGAISTSGYGRVNRREPGSWFVHRIVHEHLHGPLAPGFQVDHLCRNRLCVEPTHLEAVPQAENIRRSECPSAQFGRGRCQRGHDVTDPAVVYVSPDGRRFCATCARLRRIGQVTPRRGRRRQPLLRTDEVIPVPSDAGYATTVLVLAACIAGALLFLAVLGPAQQLMCRTHRTAGHGAIAYCSDYVQETPR